MRGWPSATMLYVGRHLNGIYLFLFYLFIRTPTGNTPLKGDVGSSSEFVTMSLFTTRYSQLDNVSNNNAFTSTERVAKNVGTAAVV